MKFEKFKQNSQDSVVIETQSSKYDQIQLTYDQNKTEVNNSTQSTEESEDDQPILEELLIEEELPPSTDPVL